MGQTPVKINAWAVGIDGLISALTAGGVSAAEAYIAASPASFLEWPVLRIFTNNILDALASSVNKYSSQLVASAVIEVQTNLEKSAVSSAVKQLNDAHASGDQDALKKANAAFDEAIASLVHWDGIAPPR